MSFLNKKKILIIGNSPDVFGKGLGKKIDAFDGLVARCNYFKLDAFEKDLGERTDVLIAGGYRTDSAQAKKKYELILWLPCCEGEPWSFCRVVAANFHKNIVSTTRKEYRDLIKVLKLKYFPSTGIRAVYYFFNKGYKVYLYGFDFMLSGQELFDGKILDMESLVGHHDSEKEKLYVEEMIKAKKLFWFDKEGV